MKIRVILGFLLLAAIQLSAQPKLVVVGGEVFDWGKVEKQKGPLKKIIKIKNEGNENLKIFAVKPGCGCTTAPLDKDELKPGETANLDITLQINKDEGKITKPITITSNDPNKEKFDIVLKAKVIVPLSVFPKMLQFGNISKTKTNVAKMVISNNTEKDIKITNVRVDPPYVKLNIKKNQVIKAGDDFTLDATLNSPKDAQGSFTGAVLLETNSKDVPVLELQMWGNVDPGK